MALSNYERVGKALELLKVGLGPFVDRELKSTFQDKTPTELVRFLGDDRPKTKQSVTEWDVALLLRVMWEAWNEVFRKPLGHAERSLVSELRDIRNRWAHQEPFSSDDTYRALDSAGRLLSSISAGEATELEKAKTESLLRLRFEEQMRTEKRRGTASTIETQIPSTLPPWREVISPHKDVASGRYQQAEFAADLWQVHMGEGTDEYRNPVEFFRRTYLTESLKHLLMDGIRRITTGGGDPVVQLQTSFGGGKTHSMLALYHLFSGTAPSELSGVDSILKDAGTPKLPHVNRVVLVGHKISPGNPSRKADGTIVRTIWGELAWQLGDAAGGPSEAKKAYKRIKEDDERATSPGDALRELFNKYGPCLILIDEWVAYARQLHDHGDLPGGSFETQFSFAQALTEAARAAKNCLLMISLPSSDTAVSPHIHADDTEVGGQRGREALERLRNVVGRLESSWRPATAEEGFEIVRRRLFEPLTEKAHFVQRDMVARAFHELYRSQQQEFPPECRDTEYEKRLIAAYPIHPEVFDRLYTDWSSLLKFQRTRGVLRLMAAVIHSLWENGDKNPLIMPANIPIDDRHVQFELTRYLSDNWPPVIEKDVDGPDAFPLQVDREIPNLGKYAACRRVARTIYLGSAPTATAAHKGIEDRRIKLGCVIPGESPTIFGDALRRLASTSTHLYQDGPRYWYSTQPTVTKLAEDRAAQLQRNPDKVAEEIEKRLRTDLRKEGDFSRIHIFPPSGADVPDDLTSRLVVLGVNHPYHKDGNSPAEVAAKAMLESRGATPRLFQNTLVFLAVDRTRLQELDAAARQYLAWEWILADREPLDLSPFQVKQAETQMAAADSTVTARLPEAYQWLLVPTQATPQTKTSWQALKLTGQDPLAVRASKKLKNDELLITGFGATRLRMELDRVPLWRGQHVSVKQLVEDFAKYLYLPRLTTPEVLLGAIREGFSLLSWEQDAFAYADGFDEANQRYTALRCGHLVYVTEANLTGLLVQPKIAAKQNEAEAIKAAGEQRPAGPAGGQTAEGKDGKAGKPGAEKPGPGAPPKVKRFHGTMDLNAARVGVDAGRIAEEVIAHLVSLIGANVKVSLEIEADVPGGVPEQVVRIVTENCQTLKFSNHEFETD